MEKSQKKELLLIIISAVLFGIVLITEHFIFKNMPILLTFILYLIPFLIVGFDILKEAVENIFKGEIFDEDFLMSLACIGAFSISFLPNTEHQFAEAVAVMLFFKIGELFEDIAVDNSRKSISSLVELRPDHASLVSGKEVIEVSPEKVNLGDIILIKAGEKIPLDCEIIEGQTTLDTKALTGESLPREATIGDTVLSGCINLNGTIKARVTKTYSQSTVSKILELVENAQSGKSKSENFIKKFAKVYTPLVVIAALLICLIPPLFSGNFMGVFVSWLKRALTFLVISCPCALVISVPLSFFGGIGGASKHGILIKGSNYIDALSKVKTVVFDKTGTLTSGTFEVTDIFTNEISENELLKIAASAEWYSTHPIAVSVKKKAGFDTLPYSAEKIEEIAGKGISAVIDGNQTFLGNEKLMQENKIDYTPCYSPSTVLHISFDGKYLGYIAISDIIKSDSKECISKLNLLGVSKTVMLTGDKSDVAKSVADSIGITDYRADLLPTDKVAIVETLLLQKPNKSTLAFVGDGINDAPVLAISDIGIAMGKFGSDAAIDAADVVLMDDKPRKVARAIEISKRTMKIVKENIIFSISVKFIILILGALGLANMWLAVLADVGVSLVAILNAMRTLK